MMEKKKKSSLFSAIKRVFSSKKETDKKKGIWGHGETRPFFPLFRTPSSIEKILGEADQLNIRPQLFLESPKTVEDLVLQKSAIPQKSVSPRACSSSDPGRYPEAFPLEAFAASSSNGAGPYLDTHSNVINRTYPPSDPEPYVPKCASNGGYPSSNPAPCLMQDIQKVSSVKMRTCSLDCYPDPEPDTTLASSSDCGAPLPRVIEGSKKISSIKKTAYTAEDKHASALRIQAAYRGYQVRKGSRDSRGVARLQAVMRGHNVRTQTLSAIKQMQLLVRVKSHIQSRRIRLLENQKQQHQSSRSEKDVESKLSKRTLSQILSESAGNGDWNDSLLTKEEEEAHLHKKAEAVTKRERAMAYANLHQLWKSNQRMVRGTQDPRFDQYPWSWSWFNHHLPVPDASQSQQPAESVASTPVPVSSESQSSTRFLTRFYNHRNSDSKSRGSITPQSTKSAAPFRPPTRHPPWTKKPLATRSLISRASPASSACDTRSKDDESLVSCPPFARPHYMTPTISAMAKVSNLKERYPNTPDSKRRFSLPFTPDSRNFKWNKRDSGSQTGSQYHESPGSNKSSVANSTVSMPVFVDRKPFNRFV